MIALTLAQIADLTGGVVRGDPAIQVTAPASVDSRSVEVGGLFVAMVGEHADGHDFVAAAMESGAAAVLAARTVDAPAVIVDNVLAALTTLARENARRLRDCGTTIIAITGSAGKTGVKDLVSQLLATTGDTVAAKGSFNNELGVPLTILTADEHTRFLVIEMGARGPGHIAHLCGIAGPHIGAVLNVGSAHVGEFGSMDNIAAAKGELVASLGPEGIAILNADDAAVLAMSDRTTAHVFTFGRSADMQVWHIVVGADGCPSFQLTCGAETVSVTMGLLGTHQALNAAAAAAIAHSAGMSLAQIGPVLSAAQPLSAMRMQRTVSDRGVVVINDAYNANPESMAAALGTLAPLGGTHHTYAVLGEMLELGPTGGTAHEQIGVLAAQLGITCVVAVGAGAKPIADGVRRAHTSTAVVEVSDVATAAEWLHERVEDGDVVLVKASRAGGLERVAASLLA